MLLPNLTSTALAQGLDLGDIRRVQASGSGEITTGDEVMGYYFMYNIDKESRKEFVYQLTITDANLEVLQEKRIVRPKGTITLGAKFNGEAIAVTLVTPKTNTVEVLIYDRQGERLGSRKFEMERKPFLQLAQQYSLMEEDGSVSLLRPVPNKGFVLYLPEVEKGMGYTMHYLPNEGKGGWKKRHVVNRGKFQVANNLAASEDYILTNILASPKRNMTKNSLNVIEARSVEDGSVVFTHIPGKGSPSLAVTNAFYEPETETFVLGGMYYKPEANMMKDESIGVALQRIDLDGKRLESAKTTWTRAFAKIGRRKTEHLKRGGSVYIHRVLPTQGGGLTAIGEYYDDEVSAMGVAGALLSAAGGNNVTSEVSLKKIVLQDLFAFEFNADFEFANAKMFAKPKKSVELPLGFGLVSPGLIAKMLDAYDAFDYSYAQAFPDRGQYTVAYRRLEPQKGKLLKQSKFVFVTQYADETEPEEKVLDRATKTTWTQYFPAKPGYVMVTDYHRKEQKMSSRLEPVD